MNTTFSLIQQTRGALPWMRAHLSDRRSLVAVAAADGALLRVLLLLSLLLALFAVPAHAWTRVGTDWRTSAPGNLVDVQVLVENRTAPLYLRPAGNFFQRDDRLYFQAFHGRNYALRVTNRTGRRVGVVIAVDGLNVVNGERTGLSRQDPMYVLDPYQSTVIRGWRTSLDQVRSFVFVDEERSYAERTGQANGDMGWIRVLTFEEAGRPAIRRGDRDDDRYRRGRDEGRPYSNNEPAPDAQGAPSEPRSLKVAPRAQANGMAPQADAYPGTGCGDRSYDPVRETWFEAVARPSDQIVLRYEYARGLRALGIDPRGDRLWDRERGEYGFARPPQW